MTIISHRKNFIYIKTIKTAGTSVESYFQQYCYSPDWTGKGKHREDAHEDSFGIVAARGLGKPHRFWRNHMAAMKIKEHLAPKLWNNYYKFCVVRNPWDKVLSWYCMQQF